MTPDRWEQINRLYHAALKLKKEERTRFVDESCGTDAELRLEVETLLAMHEGAEDFLENPAIEDLARQVSVEPPSLEGRKLGPYQVLGLLGSGGMGEVYRARDTRLDRIDALKVLPVEVATDAERLRRFVREAKAASALNHPNIATIYEIGESDSVHWIAMELVEGQTLAERIKSHPLPLPEILEISIQTAEALEEAHRKGIIHRDIKPPNIMLTTNGRVKVLDFGLAKQTGQEGAGGSTASHTAAGWIMGTVEYMSPEQVLGHKVDHRSDLFSLGVTLYDMAAGRLPFQGVTPTETMDQILHGEPEPLARSNGKIPVELEQIVQKCLEKDRELRYQTASDLKADLERLRYDTDSIRAASLVAVSPPVRVKRRFNQVLAAIIVITSFLAAASWFWFSHSRPTVLEAPLTAVPLTSYPGSEDYPSFSPDGSQVAFMWNGDKQDNFDIYVKLIGAENRLRLTTNPAPDFSPAWSPDGRQIAFLRRLSEHKVGIFLVSPIGGPEHKVAEATGCAQILSWYPDGKWLALADQGPSGEPCSLYALSLDTSEKHRLTFPPPDGFDTSPAFSPDGRSLAFSRGYRRATREIYLLSLSGQLSPKGEPEQLTFRKQWTVDPQWTADGREIVFSSNPHGLPTELWRKTVMESHVPRRVVFVGEQGVRPTISRQGHRLAFVKSKLDTDIWRLELPGPNRKVGEAVRLISSTLPEDSPQYSPDGKRIVYISARSGSREVWICASDGSDPVQLTSMGTTMMTGAPRWSPDGQWIAFDSTVAGNFDVYVVDVGGGRPKRLTNHPADDGVPSWSRDGRSIYFASNRTKRFEIWKMPAEGGGPVQVTMNGGTFPFESPDGKSVYYAKDIYQTSLWKIPVHGGKETQILESVMGFNYVVLEKGIYFEQPNPGSVTSIPTLSYFEQPSPGEGTSIRFLSFATGKVTIIKNIRQPLEPCLSISPDGRYLLYPQVEQTGSDLMLVENFK